MRLGIDYGRARVGLALGSIIARELTTLQNNDLLISKITEIIRDESVEEVVVGQPLRSRGEAGQVNEEIRQFCERLVLQSPNIVIHVVDEAFTSTQAEIELKEMGVRAEAIKSRIDQYAAKLILDQYNNEHPGII